MIDFDRVAVRGSNCQLSVVDFGGRGRPDLLVLHGTHDHALGMYPAIADLLDDYRVVGFDLRGHGHSDKPGNYSILAMVADLRAVFRALELRRPWEARRMADRSVALARFCANHPGLDVDCAALIVDNGIEAHPQGGVRWRFDPAIELIFHSYSDCEAETLCALIRCPVLLLSGDRALQFWRGLGLAGDLDEAAFERDQDRRCKLFADGCRARVAAAGHMLHYDQPAEVRRLLREFLLTRAYPAVAEQDPSL